MEGDLTLSSILEENQIYISVITEMELLSFSQLSDKEVNKIQEFLSYCTILDLSDKVKEKAINLRKTHNLQLPDAIIFGTAIAHDIAFITADIVTLEKYSFGESLDFVTRLA